MRGWTRTQIDKLGDRIRKSAIVSDDDRAQLREILATHLAPMEFVQETLQTRLGLVVRARPKTEKSTIEKLRRNPRLSTIQDLAGVRIILAERDPACAAVVARRARSLLEGRYQDRRSHPSHGYRALHLAVQHDGCWIEVQIRTRLQHRWAEIFEKLADVVGRQVRYGSPATYPDDQALVDAMHSASRNIAAIETLTRQLARRERRVLRIRDRMAELRLDEPVVQQMREELGGLFVDLAADRQDLEDAEREWYVDRLDALDALIDLRQAQPGGFQ